MKIKFIHLTEINVLCTVNLQIFREIKVPDMKVEKYLLQNYKTG